MKTLRRWFIDILLRRYMADFIIPDEKKDVSDGKLFSALRDVYNSQHLIEVLNVRVANATRRNLYVNNMEENSFWRGQIFAYRWLVTEAERMQEQDKTEENGANT